VSRELALSMILVGRYKDKMTAADRHLRNLAAETMLAGERYAAVLPNGVSPGYMLKKKDAKDPYVGDESVLFAYVQEKDPQALSDIDEVNPDFHDEAMAVLKQHAPHTVVSRVELDPKVLSGYLRAAKEDPDSAVPGIAFRTNPGSVALYPDKALMDELDAAIREGRVSLDSVLKQIEGTNGDQDS
jgi:hypothetical protein